MYQRYLYNCGCSFPGPIQFKNGLRICPKCLTEPVHIVRIDRECKKCGDIFTIIKKPEDTRIIGKIAYCEKCRKPRISKTQNNTRSHHRRKTKGKIPGKHKICQCCFKRKVAPGLRNLCEYCYYNPPDVEEFEPHRVPSHSVFREVV